jgi:hypothetical protein
MRRQSNLLRLDDGSHSQAIESVESVQNKCETIALHESNSCSPFLRQDNDF